MVAPRTLIITLRGCQLLVSYLGYGSTDLFLNHPGYESARLFLKYLSYWINRVIHGSLR
jgi:hypothetical protein